MKKLLFYILLTSACFGTLDIFAQRGAFFGGLTGAAIGGAAGGRTGAIIGGIGGAALGSSIESSRRNRYYYDDYDDYDYYYQPRYVRSYSRRPVRYTRTYRQPVVYQQPAQRVIVEDEEVVNGDSDYATINVN